MSQIVEHLPIRYLALSSNPQGRAREVEREREREKEKE
jgi:hypothetical protein